MKTMYNLKDHVLPEAIDKSKFAQTEITKI